MKRNIAIPFMLAFGVALAAIIGQRMTTDAMAVVVGVAVGVAASVPTSLLLVALLRRERRPNPETPAQTYQQLAPPSNAVILDTAQLAALLKRQPAYMPLPPPNANDGGGMRRLRIVGNDDTADWEE